MAKKIIKLYKENELQENAIIEIAAGEEKTLELDTDKVAVKNVTIKGLDVEEDSTYTLNTISMDSTLGSSNYKSTYLSFHSPTSANDYALKSAVGGLNGCSSATFKDVRKVYVWGNGYCVDELGSSAFVDLSSNTTYDKAKAVPISKNQTLYLNYYYTTPSGGNHSSGSD